MAIALKVGDSVLGQKDNCTWGDLDWELQPPVEVYTVEDVCVEITHGFATPQSEHWDLAKTKFVDPASLDGDALDGREPLQLKHELATVKIHFTVDEESLPPWLQRLWRYVGRLLGFDGSSDAVPVTTPPVAKCAVSLTAPRSELPQHGYSQHDAPNSDRVGVDVGNIGGRGNHGRYLAPAGRIHEGDVFLEWASPELKGDVLYSDVPVQQGRLVPKVKGNERPATSQPLQTSQTS